MAQQDPNIIGRFVGLRGQLIGQQRAQQQIAQQPQRDRLLGLQLQGRELSNQQQQAQIARFTEESNLRSMVQGALSFQQVGDDPEQQNLFLNKRINEITRRGGDPSDTLELLQTPAAQRGQVIENVLNIGRQRGIISQKTQPRFAAPFAAETTGGESVFLQQDPTTGGLSQVQEFRPTTKTEKGQQQTTLVRNLIAQGLEPGTPAFQAAIQTQLQRPEPAGQQPTTLVRNITAAGFKEGTPQFQTEIKKQLNKGFNRPTELQRNLRLAGIEPDSSEGQKIIKASLVGSKTKLSISPDGSISFASGVGLEEGATPIERKTRTDLESKLVNFEQNISDLNRIETQFKPDFLTFLGRGKAFLSGIKSKAGVRLTGDEKRFVQQRRKFTQNINQFFNRYRKEITGAAASVQELEGLKKSMFNEDLSPVEFDAAFSEFKSGVLRSRRLVRKMLREGVQGDLRNKNSEVSKQFNAQFLGGGDDDTQDRIKDLLGEGKTEDEIGQVLDAEGYI